MTYLNKEGYRMKSCLKKFIFIIFIYALLLCFGTSLHATQDYDWGKNNSLSYDDWNDWKELKESFFNKYGKGYWKQKLLSEDEYDAYKTRKKRYDVQYGEGWCKRDKPNKPPGCNAPEPISSALFVLGGAGLGLYRKFKNKD